MHYKSAKLRTESSGTFGRKLSRSRALVTDRWAVRGWDNSPELESRMKRERASTAGAGTGATGSGAPGHRSTRCRPWWGGPPPSRDSPLSISISWRGVVWSSQPPRTDRRFHAKASSRADNDRLASDLVVYEKKSPRPGELRIKSPPAIRIRCFYFLGTGVRLGKICILYLNNDNIKKNIYIY